MLGPGPRLIKKNLPGRGLTKIEKHWPGGKCSALRSSTSSPCKLTNEAHWIGSFVCYRAVFDALYKIQISSPYWESNRGSYNDF